MSEMVYSGDMAEMQKEMGKDQFSRAVSMESFQRTMNEQLQERLKLIATGQPIPVKKSEPDASEEILAKEGVDAMEESQSVDDPTEDSATEEESSEISEELTADSESVEELSEEDEEE